MRLGRLRLTLWGIGEGAAFAALPGPQNEYIKMSTASAVVVIQIGFSFGKITLYTYLKATSPLANFLPEQAEKLI